MTEPTRTLLRLASERFGPLLHAENRVIRSAVTGKRYKIRPNPNAPLYPALYGSDSIVRSELISWMLLNPAANVHLSRHGLDLCGLCFKGELDISHIRAAVPIRLTGCTFTHAIDIKHSDLSGLYIKRCRLVSIDGDGAKIRTALRLSFSIVEGGDFRIRGATIGGQLECDGSRFGGLQLNQESPEDNVVVKADGLSLSLSAFFKDIRSDGALVFNGATINGHAVFSGAAILTAGIPEPPDPEEVALSFDGARIRGAIFLGDGCQVRGETRLNGVDAYLLDCSGGQFENPNGLALTAQGARFGASVRLGSGFVAKGQVAFSGSHIGDQLTCRGAVLDNERKICLLLEGTRIGSSLMLDQLRQPVNGAVSLIGARVPSFADDESSWPPANYLGLIGFRYENFMPPSPMTASKRITWLHRQTKPINIQPFEHLIKVFKLSGQIEDARTIAIQKQRLLTARHQSSLYRFWGSFLDCTIGYGYKPWRILWYFGFLWIFAFSFFHVAARVNSFYPSNLRYAEQAELANFAHYPSLEPMVYALDVFLPFIDFHQASYWEIDPSGQASILFLIVFWIVKSLGWLFTILAAIAFSGALREDI